MLIYLALIEGEADKRKFERLYMNYRQTMYYIAYGILKNRAVAEDAVHQAFLRVIDRLEKINEEDCHKTRGYLVIITKHIAIDMYRKQQREQALSYEELEYSVADTVGSDRTNEIWQAFDQLPANYSIPTGTRTRRPHRCCISQRKTCVSALRVQKKSWLKY